MMQAFKTSTERYFVSIGLVVFYKKLWSYHFYSVQFLNE